MSAAASQLDAQVPLRRVASIRPAAQLEYAELRLCRLSFSDGVEAVTATALAAQRVDSMVPQAAKAGAAARYTFREEETALRRIDERKSEEAVEAAQKAQREEEARARRQRLNEEEARRRDDEARARREAEERRAAEERSAREAEQARRAEEQERRLHGVTPEQRAQLQRFLSITGERNEELSLLLLQASDFDLEQATSAYFDANSDVATALSRVADRQARQRNGEAGAGGRPGQPAQVPAPAPAAAPRGPVYGGGGGGGGIGGAYRMPSQEPQASLLIKTTDGVVHQQVMAGSSTLWDLVLFINSVEPAAAQKPYRIRMTWPQNRLFNESDYNLTLLQASLVPEARLDVIV